MAKSTADPNWRFRSRTVARLVAEFLTRRGVCRVYGLCGGHIHPVWDDAAAPATEVLDVRNESASVDMARTDLTVAVVMVTADPVLTSAVSGLANASVSRYSALVISECLPRPKAGMGAFQGMPQRDLIRQICRRVEVVYERHHILPRPEATIRAVESNCGTSIDLAYIDSPTDLLREVVIDADVDERFFEPRAGKAHAFGVGVIPDTVGQASARDLGQRSKEDPERACDFHRNQRRTVPLNSRKPRDDPKRPARGIQRQSSRGGSPRLSVRPVAEDLSACAERSWRTRPPCRTVASKVQKSDIREGKR